MLFYFVWIDFVSPLQLRGRRPTRPIQRRLTASRPACGGDCQYVAASYVKYIESAGARGVPISYNANQSHLDFLFASLDGFLFPGGHFPETAQYIFDRTAVAANDRGGILRLGSSATRLNPFEAVRPVRDGYIAC